MKANMKPFWALVIGCLTFVQISVAQTTTTTQNPGKTSYANAENLRKQNRCDEALIKYDEAIKLEPTNYKYYFGKGKCQYKKKDYNGALASFNMTVQSKKDFTPAYSLMAKIYASKKDYDNAIFYYNEAFNYEQSASRKVQYKLLVVKMLMGQKKFNEASNELEKCKQMDPTNPQIQYYDAELKLQSGDYEGAKAAYMNAIESMKDQPVSVKAKYYYGLGLCYNKLGDYDNAKKTWQNANVPPYNKLIAQQLSTTSPSYYYKVAMGYYFISDFTSARTQLNNAFKLQTNFSGGYMLLAKMDKKEGKLSSAVSNFMKALEYEADPAKKSKILTSLLSVQMDAGDYNGALSSVNQLLSAQNTNVALKWKKALCLYHTGDYSSAAGLLQTLLGTPNLDAKSKSQYNFLLGMCLKNSGDKDGAKTAFKGAAGSFKGAAKIESDALK